MDNKWWQQCDPGSERLTFSGDSQCGPVMAQAPQGEAVLKLLSSPAHPQAEGDQIYSHNGPHSEPGNLPVVWGYTARFLATSAEQMVRVTSFPLLGLCPGASGPAGEIRSSTAFPGGSLLQDTRGQRDEAVTNAGAKPAAQG